MDAAQPAQEVVKRPVVTADSDPPRVDLLDIYELRANGRETVVVSTQFLYASNLAESHEQTFLPGLARKCLNVDKLWREQTADDILNFRREVCRPARLVHTYQ